MAVASDTESKLDALSKCLQREYASFFNPMEKSFYSPDVTFEDPLITISGIDKYESNLKMLSGESMLGNFAFDGASLTLYRVDRLSELKLRSRWLLRLKVKFLPWQPVASFTGVSEYTLNEAGKIVKQVDYWDSINLVESTNGVEQYQSVDKPSALKVLGPLLADLFDLESENLSRY